MSGRLIELTSGKVPQRAIRYLNQLPYAVTYEAEGVVDFGDTGDSGGFVFATPANLRGKPLAVDIFDNGEIFAGTTAAKVEIGDGSDQDEFAYCTMAATTDAQSFTANAGTLIIGDTEIIQAGDQVTLTCVDAVTSPTGQAKVALTMLYFE